MTKTSTAGVKKSKSGTRDKTSISLHNGQGSDSTALIKDLMVKYSRGGTGVSGTS